MSFFTKNDIIEMAVKMEQNGYAFYDEALQRKDLDAETQAILTKLRDEEKQHEKTFLALRSKIDNLDLRESPGWKEAKSYIESMVESHVFNDEGKAIQLAQKAENATELLKYAVQFEKDTILFFYTFSRYVQEKKADEAVNAIINEESKHIRLLRELIKEILN
ncbi:MAG: ferritin family protein [Candidatus Cloacimonadales bacterium]|nr:ferritin family protein [Candidatus Cloacimonadales bacterium]